MLALQSKLTVADPYAMKQLKIITLSVDPWSELWKRKQRLMYELTQFDEVAAVLYVNPPRYGNVINIFHRFLLGRLAKNERVEIKKTLLSIPDPVSARCWTYQSIANFIPLSRFDLISHYDARIMYRLIKTCADRLPGQNIIFWLYDPFDWPIVDRFPNRKLVCFDWTEDWAAFTNPVGIRGTSESIDTQSRKIIKQADLVFTVSEQLFQQAIKLNAATTLLPNATDFRLLGNRSRGDQPMPSDISNLPRPVIGYVGQIREDRIDSSLAIEIAQGRPDWSFVYLGPIMARGKGIQTLSALNNVHFLGSKSYSEIARYLRSFDVCIIPHICNRLILSMDPIKLYDYLASGKPIVTTPVSGIEGIKDLIYVAETTNEFLGQMDLAVKENSPDLAEKRKAYAEANSWQSRAKTVMDQFEVVLANKAGEVE
jgi:glycosyltransferase involved in cell wall biosynthesis